VPADIETVDVELKSFSRTLPSEPMLKNPEDVQDAIRVLKLGKARCPKGIPNRDLKHLNLLTVLLVQIFSAVLCTHHFPPAWKLSRVTLLNPGKEPTQLSSYWPIRLLKEIGKTSCLPGSFMNSESAGC
jgi:hypothetical protein